MAFGDPTAGADKSKSAEGILRQIEGLLHQYLDLGDSTPLADQAQSFLSQVQDGISQVQGAGEPEPAESEGSSPTDFRSATKAAADVYAKGGPENSSSNGETKTEPEQSQSDEQKKRKGSRPF